MKRKTCAVILAMILSTVTLSGCEQTIAKNYGGDMTIDLPPGRNWRLSHGKMIVYGI